MTLTPKQYLSQIRWLDSRIGHKLEELEEYRDKVRTVTAVVYDKDPVQTSSSGDALPSAVAKIVDMEAEIRAIVDDYFQTRSRIINEIDSLENHTYRDILYMRYVKYMPLLDIADELNYSYDWIRERHGAALEEFGRLIKYPQKPTSTYDMM